MTTPSAERGRRGTLGEHLAARFLELDGATILARRLRAAGVEIDLVARQERCLVVVEVKLRATSAEEAVDAVHPRQAARLRRAAAALLAHYAWADAARIDVVTLDWNTRAGTLRMRRLRGVCGL